MIYKEKSKQTVKCHLQTFMCVLEYFVKLGSQTENCIKQIETTCYVAIPVSPLSTFKWYNKRKFNLFRLALRRCLPNFKLVSSTTWSSMQPEIEPAYHTVVSQETCLSYQSTSTGWGVTLDIIYLIFRYGACWFKMIELFMRIWKRTKVDRDKANEVIECWVESHWNTAFGNHAWNYLPSNYYTSQLLHDNPHLSMPSECLPCC